MNNESFAFYITILRKQFVSYCTERIAKFGVTYCQLFVLIYISKNNECSPKEIAEYLKLDPGQLNRILTKLLEKDLITQRKNSNDRRFKILNLTKSGIKIVEESHKLFYSWDKKVLSAIDDDSRQELMTLMKKLVFRLNENDGGKQNEQIKRFYENINREL